VKPLRSATVVSGWVAKRRARTSACIPAFSAKPEREGHLFELQALR
jgi:hypothetical protein